MVNSAVAQSSESVKAELREVGVERFTARDYRPGRVSHIVLFRFAESVSDEKKLEVANRFHALAASERHGAPYISSIASGVQQSGEVDAGGYEYGFVVLFDSLGDRNYYVGAPIVEDPAYFDGPHADFKDFVGPLLAATNGAQVFDFIASSPIS
jgi:hypothetical protein